MANEINKRDANRVTVMTAVTDDENLDISQLRVDPITKRLKVDQNALSSDTDTVSVAIPSDMYGGGKISVGTTAVEVSITGTTKTIIISSDSANTGELYIGKSNVLSTGANSIAFLLPGESIELDYNDATNAVYVVSNTTSQNFYKGALL